MSKAIIQVENLGKRYHIKHQSEPQRYTALRDVITEKFKSVLRTRPSSPTTRPSTEDFWALKDVSFEVKQGEVLGIIGSNGAGKSTLLKILSRITEPTMGRVRIKGRVASLLEVGTGFHPELTGRENIFLNGAILGMTREEIKRKFDEIVAFAEVEKFLDTPVKRYSSGMYVRLAFAVAAHLEPEILIVDEVLAVGDAAFQKKCLGKMGQVAQREGKTVLFVSHNLGAIRSLTQRAILLNQGRLEMEGEPAEVINQYMGGNLPHSKQVTDLTILPRSAGSQIALLEAWMENEKGELLESIPINGCMAICVRFKANRPIARAGFGFGIENAESQRLFSLSNYITRADSLPPVQAGTVVCRIPQVALMPSTYSISLSFVENMSDWVDFVERALTFTVEGADVFKSGHLPRRDYGVFVQMGDVTVKTSHTFDNPADQTASQDATESGIRTPVLSLRNHERD